jgi:general secretion pathway protein J
MKRGRGFTLIELLIAMAIFAVVAMMAYGGLNTVMSTRVVVQQQAEALKRLQLAYRMMQQDLEQAVNRPIRDTLGGERGALLALGANTELLELTRNGWRNPINQPRSSLQRVQYGLVDEELRRRYWLVLDQAQDSEPVEQTLLDGVQRVEIRYMDSGRQWYDQWPPPNAQGPIGIPRAAEVNLELENWGKLRWLFRLAG